MKHFLLTLIILCLSACAGVSPSGGNGFGDRVGNISNQWKKGEQDVRHGNSLIDMGNKMIAKGERESREGAEQASSARTSLITATKQYSDAAAREASDGELNNLSRAVKAAEKRLNNARKLKDNGTRNLRDGENKVAQGKALIARGEARMNEAEAAYENGISRPVE